MFRAVRWLDQHHSESGMSQAGAKPKGTGTFIIILITTAIIIAPSQSAYFASGYTFESTLSAQEPHGVRIAIRFILQMKLKPERSSNVPK